MVIEEVRMEKMVIKLFNRCCHKTSVSLAPSLHQQDTDPQNKDPITLKGFGYRARGG